MFVGMHLSLMHVRRISNDDDDDDDDCFNLLETCIDYIGSPRNGTKETADKERLNRNLSV